MPGGHRYQEEEFSNTRLLLEFIREPVVNWLVERGIGVSIERYEDPVTMTLRADLFAQFTATQLEEWREYNIIDKLTNSYNIT